MIVLAHRCNVAGPQRGSENSLPALNHALYLGFGIETDVRHAQGFGFYISHDRIIPQEADRLEAHAAHWRSHPDARIALNIKELGNEQALVAALSLLGVEKQVFLFDMELIEADPGTTALVFKEVAPEISVAARVSDRGESADQALSIEVADTIWLDEFDGPWVTPDITERLLQAGKKVFAVAPDLHGYPLDQSIARWHQFADWRLTGICTDWPLLLKKTLDL